MKPEEELVYRVFCTRNYAHASHWKTKSYAEHMALGSFYEDIIEEIDTFIEQFQGAFGLIKLKMDNESEEENEKTEDEKEILEILQEDVKWMNKNRSEICRKVSALENTFDGITGVYLQTIYKLRFLS